jgi:hypothetical protein
MFTDGKPKDCGTKDGTTKRGCGMLNDGIKMQIILATNATENSTLDFLAKMTGCGNYTNLPNHDKNTTEYIGKNEDGTECPFMRTIATDTVSPYVYMGKKADEDGLIFSTFCSENTTDPGTPFASGQDEIPSYPIPSANNCTQACENYYTIDFVEIEKKLLTKIHNDVNPTQWETFTHSVQITHWKEPRSHHCNCSFERTATSTTKTQGFDVGNAAGTQWNSGCVEWGPTQERKEKCLPGADHDKCESRKQQAEDKIKPSTRSPACQIDETIS